MHHPPATPQPGLRSRGATRATRMRRVREGLGRAWDWIAQHEAAPAPYAAGRGGRWTLGLVALAALAYGVVLSVYTTGLQHAYRTHAEDLGIMDQVLWNTAHGHFMLQTICNPVSDQNCLGGVSRFAIHFEPILIPLAVLYLFAARIKVLLVLQAVAVASGAFPAYLLATRRLRGAGWGLLFAALYLVSPALLSAVVTDFHPETLAAPAVLWALYFMIVRRDRALILTCLFLLTCKETLALDVFMIGLFVAVAQRRPRLGLALSGVAVATLALALTLMHLLSPIGYSPVAGRLTPLLHAPVATLLSAAHDPARLAYLVRLLAPVGFLPLLSPWSLLIAAPSMLVNALSSDPHMYSGQYQYNTDIVPVLLAAAVDALVWVRPVVGRLAGRLGGRLRGIGESRPSPRWLRPGVVIPVLLVPALIVGGQAPVVRAYRDLTVRQSWPAANAHTRLARQLIARIPLGASVSAQSTLVPHLSHRPRIHQFPSGAYTDDYVMLDVTTGNYYPYTSPGDYEAAIRALLTSCTVSVVAAEDGYLLLRRASGPAPCDLSLPATFYSFIYRAPPANAVPVAATFDGTLRLTAYAVDPPRIYTDEPELTVTTCWKALASVPAPLTVVVTLSPPHGSRMVFDDQLGQEWLPPQAWTPGRSVCLRTWPIYVPASDRGTLLLGVEVRAGTPESHPPVRATVPVSGLATPPAGPLGLPREDNGGTNVLLAAIPLS